MKIQLLKTTCINLLNNIKKKPYSVFVSIVALIFTLYYVSLTSIALTRSRIFYNNVDNPSLFNISQKSVFTITAKTDSLSGITIPFYSKDSDMQEELPLKFEFSEEIKSNCVIKNRNSSDQSFFEIKFYPPLSVKKGNQYSFALQSDDVDVLLNGSAIIHKQYGFPKVIKYAGVFAFLMALCLVYLFLRKTYNLSSEKKFLLYAIILCLCYLFMRPPCSKDDDIIHYDSAYNMSNVILGLGDARITGTFEKRVCDVNLIPEYYPDNYDKYNYSWYDNWKLYLPHMMNNFSFCPDTSLVSVRSERVLSVQRSYMFFALGISLCRLLGCNQFITYYFGILCNILVCVFVIFIALWRTKNKYNSFIICFSLFPTVLMSFASYSYDSLLGSFAFAIFICVMNAFDNNKMKLFDICFLIFLILFIFPIKVVYFLIALFPLVIIKIPAKIKKYMIAGAICISVFLIIFGVHHYLVSENNSNNYSVKFLLQNPFQFISLILGYFDNGTTFKNITQIIIYKHGHNMALVELISILILVLIFFNTPKLSDKLCFTSFIIVLLTTLFIVLVCCTWTSLNDITVWGTNGRYFMSLLPFICVASRKFVPSNLYIRDSYIYPLLYILNIFYIVEIPFTIFFR